MNFIRNFPSILFHDPKKDYSIPKNLDEIKTKQRYCENILCSQIYFNTIVEGINQAGYSLNFVKNENGNEIDEPNQLFRFYTILNACLRSHELLALFAFVFKYNDIGNFMCLFLTFFYSLDVIASMGELIFHWITNEWIRLPKDETIFYVASIAKIVIILFIIAIVYKWWQYSKIIKAVERLNKPAALESSMEEDETNDDKNEETHDIPIDLVE